MLQRQMPLVCCCIPYKLTSNSYHNDNFANGYIYTAVYLLITVCLIIALLHYHVQPYKNTTLNRYDGFILQLLVQAVSLQMVTVCESTGFTSDAIVGVSYVLIFVPIIVYIIPFVYYQVCSLHVGVYK